MNTSPNAAQEVQQLNQLSVILKAFPLEVQHTPAFLKLASDPATAQAIAGKVSNAITLAQRFGQAIAMRIQLLPVKINVLVARAAALQSTAAALAAIVPSVLQGRLGVLQGHFALLRSEFAATVADITWLFGRAAAVASQARGRLVATKQDLATNLGNLREE